MTKTLSICNLGGGTVAPFVGEFLQKIPKEKKVIVVEYPCLGIPQMSYIFHSLQIKKEKTMDQYLLDMDRQQYKSIKHYISQTEGIDALLIHSKSLPENPTIQKIKNNQTFIQMPYKIKQQLQAKYDLILYVLQGTMIHPMTHFSIRCADATIFYSSGFIEFGENYTNYRKFRDIFGIEKERLLFYADTATQIQGTTVKLYTRLPELWKQIDQLIPLPITDTVMPKVDEQTNRERIGIIHPLDFLNVQPSEQNDTIQSEDEQKKIEELTTYVRSFLQTNHLDDFVKSFVDTEARQRIKYLISDRIQEQSDYYFTLPIQQVIDHIQKEITGLGVLQDALDDPHITSIEINAPDQIIVEKNGITEHLADIRFRDVNHLYRTIGKILQPIGKPLTSNEPIIDANYRGFRICAVADNQEYQGVSARSPLLSIRKFPPSVYSHEQCIAYGNLSQEIVDFLQFIVPCHANIIIAGGTNSGKTTQLIRLPLFVSPLTRIISIEDTEEMMLASKKEYEHYVNLPSLLVKKMDDSEKSYEINRLITSSLRLNPTVIAIGEVREESAARQLLIAMNTGHIGWSSIHANSATEAAIRLLQLNGNTVTAASQIGTSIDLILFQKKLKNGVRVVTEISELIGYKGGEEPILNPIFIYNYRTKKHQRIGSIQSSSLTNKIEQQEIPEEVMKIWCQMGRGVNGA